MKTAEKCTARTGRWCPVCYLALLLFLGVNVLNSCSMFGNQTERESSPPEITPPETAIAQTATSVPLTVDTSRESENWMLTLVNRWNLMDFDRQIPLLQLDNGLYVDERCYPDLQEMMDDCRAAGYSPIICSAYRSEETQRQLFEAKVSEFLPQLMNVTDAEEEAEKVVARPGESEHHLGLAIDIVDQGYQLLDEGQEDTPVQQWLMENSWRYGFILRYPQEKSQYTGIIYEPWHYRYVGKETAEEIYRLGICLEEYLEQEQECP